MQNGSHITAGRAVRFALMPEVFPRIGSLFFSGFGIVPYLLALLCARARLLPKGHTFFHSKEKFGVRHVLAEAARHIDLRWRNIDQVIVYIALLSGAAALFGFIAVLLAYVVFSSTAHAAAWVPGIFQTADPTHDIAFMMLDRVFGIPGIYDSEIITNPAKYGASPNLFQTALHTLFGFFSWGLFSIAVFIFLYFVVEMIWDVTQTGNALDSISDDAGDGKGFAWIPLRLVLALGLLVPLSNGLNSAQYITLYVAKFGSGMATNAWGYFNMATGSNPMGLPNEELVAWVEQQDTSSLVKQLLILKGCKYINDYNALAIVASGSPMAQDGTHGSYNLDLYIINGNQNKTFSSFTSGNYDATPMGVISSSPADPFAQILGFSGGQGITLVLGYVDPSDPTKYKEYPGGVLPVCGEVNIPLTGFNGENLFAAEAFFYGVVYIFEDIPRFAGANGDLDNIEKNSFLAVMREFNRNSSGVKQFLESYNDGYCWYDTDHNGSEGLNPALETFDLGVCTDPVPSSYWEDLINDVSPVFDKLPRDAAWAYLTDTLAPSYKVNAYRIGDTRYSVLSVPDPFMVSIGMVELGWGGAGMWYNRISEKNGSFISAVGGVPTVRKMPLVMEKIKAEKDKNDPSAGGSFCGPYSPQKSGSTSSNISDERAQFAAELVKNLHMLCTTLFENQNILIKSTTGSPVAEDKSSNAIEHAMASIFGQMKMFDLRENDKVLPMAQLSSIGRMLIDKSIMSITAALGLSVSGSLLHVVAGSADGDSITALNTIGSALGDAAGAALSFATFGLTIGIVLHYVLPFLPFMYFFFAVGRWVKTVFEAMVGVPLWALAHLRLSGPGLPGDAASSGYFLLLEIFVRPIITVLALVGSFAVFTALVMVLNSIFILVTSNISGADTATLDPDVIATMRGIADQFFYTIMYVILVYMIGTAAFKMIDVIPDNIMRWSGAGVGSFGAGDNADDLIDQLQYQMPLMMNYYAKKTGRMITESAYDSGKMIGMKRQAEYDKLTAEVYQQAASNGQISKSEFLSHTKADHGLANSVFDTLERKGKLVRSGGDYYKPVKE